MKVIINMEKVIAILKDDYGKTKQKWSSETTQKTGQDLQSQKSKKDFKYV